MRIRTVGDGRVFEGTAKEIVEAMHYISFGQEHRTLSEYIDWSADRVRQMNAIDFVIEGDTVEEKAASYVKAMLEAGFAERH